MGRGEVELCGVRRLTPPSRGRPQAGFARLRSPLTSNVRPRVAGTAECPVVMRAQLSAENLPCMPSLAWAARPLAGGVRSLLIERRSVRCLGVGCPSFGGQRSGNGGSSRIRAALVTSTRLQRTAKRSEVFALGSNSQTASSAVMAAEVKAIFAVEQLGSRSLPRQGRRAWQR